MNVKRSLQSRIRGWFPQEPEGLKLSIAPDFGAKNPMPAKNYKPGSARVLSPINIAIGLFINLLLVMFLFRADSLPSFSFSGPLGNYVVMAIAGVAVGVVVGMLPAYKILEQLTKGHKTYIKSLKIVTINLAYIILVFGTLLYFFMIHFGTRTFTEFNELFFIFSFSSCLAMVDSTYVCYAVWERRNHCKLWRYNGLFFMVPKSGQNSNLSQSDQNSGNKL